ncbi:purine-cytosine permease family protein [Cryobacterium roopkundense]|uniref:Purine-cytosine permease-like protein n=1 Tax=Cryobacterium roopkundense TaxID=1001240 RepID=A0A7W9E592_9MICO|nr:cytosine permease [Cryobacterium roopkundense]MBB5642234.1 purine-cytosine permease-like protein [Cryobacterium roopkundense]
MTRTDSREDARAEIHPQTRPPTSTAERPEPTAAHPGRTASGHLEPHPAHPGRTATIHAETHAAHPGHAAAQRPEPRGTAHPDRDAAGRIETHGVDFVPTDQRHGRPRELTWIWMSTNVVYLNFVLGGTMTLLGLSLVNCLLVVLLGNLWWLLVGYLAISGPAAGSPSVVIMRAIFGVRGNRMFGAGLGVLIGLLYVIINLAFAFLAGMALLEFLGVAPSSPLRWLVLLVVAAATFTVSVYGHATITKLSPWLTLALAACFGVLGFFILGAADFGYTVAAQTTDARWAAFLLGFTIISSGPLSWGTGADYSRYLPERSKPSRVLIWTAIGGFIPAVLIAWLGVLAGTRMDMTDPQTALLQILPGWFYPVFLFAILLGSTANNVLCSYSTSLYIQALGVRLPRAATVLLTAAITIAASAWLLFVAESFLDTLNSALEISVAVLGPSVAVYAADLALRRNRYSGPDLALETPDSPFWFSGGYCWPGIIAISAATLAAVATSNTTLYQGPISVLLDGADLSALVGPPSSAPESTPSSGAALPLPELIRSSHAHDSRPRHSPRVHPNGCPKPAPPAGRARAASLAP